MAKLPITLKQFREQACYRFVRANPGAIIRGDVFGPKKVKYPTGLVGYVWIFIADNGFRIGKMTATYDAHAWMIR